MWGYPLVVMHRTRALHCSRVGPGVLNHRDDLATPASRTVVAPNNDTLYSSGWFDLSIGDVVVDVPPMDRPGRSWSVMALDAYTHVTYASRRLHGTDGVTVRFTYEPTAEWSREASTTIPVGTPTAWLLVRVMVDGPDDLETARRLQRGITATPPASHPRAPTTPLGPPNRAHDAGAAFFDELAAALALDPPAAWHPQPSPEVAAFLADPHALDDAALAGAVAAGERVLTSRPLGNDVTANGWGTKRRGSDFGDDVVDRAASAKFALAGHHPAENRTYVARADDRGARLDGAHPLMLTFPPGGTPPTNAFWSLTVYGADMFFVENEIDRWSIGDRTPGVVDDDGGATITIGGPRPADVTSWLPAPAGPYLLALRVYEGRPEVVDATWFPPPLRRS